MIERVRLHSESESKAKSITSARVERFTLFGPPQLLVGEDAAAYDEFLGRVCEAVKPLDIFEEIFIADLVALGWEVLRWRRLKLSVMQERGHRKLVEFLYEKLDYELYTDHFVDELTEVLQDNGAEDQAESFAQTLARQCAGNDPNAVDKVNEILADIDLDIDNILGRARIKKAKELADEYARREPNSLTLIQELFAQARTGIDALMAQALVYDLESIEQIDQLTTIAENRRNAALRELDRHRMGLGETLRRSMQDVVDGEFKEIETTPAEGKDAA